MKSLFAIMLLAIGMMTTATLSQAQTRILMPTVAGDTVVNTGTVAKVFTATGTYSGVTVQVNLVKVSGTGAGTAQMQGSLDGVTYTNIGSAYTITNTSTQSGYFSIAAPLPPYLKCLLTGSGTEVAGVKLYYRFASYK